MFKNEEEFVQYISGIGGTAYLVGGAVRDEMLGRPVKDRDYVITGVDQEHFSGWNSVGNKFPVYLVPVGGEICEVALARRERKIGRGHRGFEVEFDKNVTIEEDLGRRDFTMNAIAKDLLTGQHVDPFFGTLALRFDRELSHLSGAFKDDPLRILRAARFSAILGMKISSDTMRLMSESRYSLSELSPERVFQELRTVLLRSEKPSVFFRALKDTGCLVQWFMELQQLIGVQAGPEYSKHGLEDSFDHTMNVIDGCRSPLPEHKFACLCHDLGKSLSPTPPKHHGHGKAGLPLVEAFCDRLKVPNSYRKAALCFTRYHMTAHRILEMRSGKAARLVCDIQKSMPGGFPYFVCCCIPDGMEEDTVLELQKRATRVLSVRLPEQYHGKGAACAEIMTNLRGKAWKW